MAKLTLDILFDNTVPEPNTGCLIWTGRLKGGYPYLTGYSSVIRWVVDTVNGQSVKGLYACHSCGHSWCAAPEHLYAGTPAQNTADAIRHGTFRKARLAPWSGLTVEQRRQGTRQLRESLAASRSSKTPEQRKAEAANGLAGIARWYKSMTPEQYDKWYAAVTAGPGLFWDRLRALPEVERKAWLSERARRSWVSRRRNAAARPGG